MGRTSSINAEAINQRLRLNPVDYLTAFYNKPLAIGAGLGLAAGMVGNTFNSSDSQDASPVLPALLAAGIGAGLGHYKQQRFLANVNELAPGLYGEFRSKYLGAEAPAPPKYVKAGKWFDWLDNAFDYADRTFGFRGQGQGHSMRQAASADQASNQYFEQLYNRVGQSVEQESTRKEVTQSAAQATTPMAQAPSPKSKPQAPSPKSEPQDPIKSNQLELQTPAVPTTVPIPVPVASNAPPAPTIVDQALPLPLLTQIPEPLGSSIPKVFTFYPRVVDDRGIRGSRKKPNAINRISQMASEVQDFTRNEIKKFWEDKAINSSANRQEPITNPALSLPSVPDLPDLPPASSAGSGQAPRRTMSQVAKELRALGHKDIIQNHQIDALAQRYGIQTYTR